MERSYDNWEKDTQGNSLSLMDSSISLSYRKTNKLTTALYMVTDMMDKEEPLRQKLRTLAVEILSDITSAKGSVLTVKVANNIQEILYFLDIAETLEFISRMNSRVLKNEFLELRKAIQEYKDNISLFAGKNSLVDFFKEEQVSSIVSSEYNTDYPIGHLNPTRIGVQKGNSLLKALSDKMSFKNKNVSDRNTNSSPLEKKSFKTTSNSQEDFNLLKKERRDQIIHIIKNDSKGASEGVSITDIKNRSFGPLKSASEKTLQRELVSMVKDNILKKTGDKRWSRYFLAS